MKKVAVCLRNELTAIICAGMTGLWFLMTVIIRKGTVAIYAYPKQAGTFFSQILKQATARDMITGLCVAILLFLFFHSVCRKDNQFLEWLDRRRIIIAALLFLLCIILNINNTSLSCWTSYIGLSGAENDVPVLGVARNIRSDEWAVWSPFTLAQDATGYQTINTLIAGGGTDPTWISVGGIPAFSVAALFKPFYWGFLLFGAARGYSFLFAARIILLFLVSLETAKIYTRKQLHLSYAAAILLTLSPYVQWWFSQSIAEVLIFGQGIVLCLMRMISAGKNRDRILAGAGLAWCFGCYCMIGYISWLISGAYLIIPACVLVIRQHRKQFRKQDTIVLLFLLAVAGILAVILLNSRETLSRVQESVYPGQRLETGGVLKPGIVSGLFSMFLPFIDPVVSNSCECSGWITLFPAGIIIGIGNIFQKKKADPLSIVLIAVEVFFLLFVLAGFPAWLAKCSLLFQVNRPEMILGVTDTILLIRGLSEKRAYPVFPAFGLAIACALISISTIGEYYHTDGFTKTLIAAITTGLGTLAFSASQERKAVLNLVTCGLITAALLGGAFVNPVQRGIDSVENLKLVQAIKEIPTQEDECWFTEAEWPITNVPLLAGKRAVNTTQPYPSPKQWEKLDPEKQYTDVYNRFCHITAELTEGENTFSLLSDDHIQIQVNGDGLRKLGATYVLTRKAYPAEWDGLQWTHIQSVDGFLIYRVKALSDEL